MQKPPSRELESKCRSLVSSKTQQICKEVGQKLNLEFESDARDLVAEVVWKKLLSYGADLEAFSKHAKRSIINPDDVKLLVRGNSSLKEAVEGRMELLASLKPQTSANSSAAGNKRKRAGSNNV